LIYYDAIISIGIGTPNVPVSIKKKQHWEARSKKWQACSAPFFNIFLYELSCAPSEKNFYTRKYFSQY